MTLIRTFASCETMWATRKRKLANNTYLVQEWQWSGPGVANDVSYGVKLHSTIVVEYRSNDDIVLNSGGWRSTTTKARINEFSPVRVWSEKSVWYLTWGGKTHVFADGIVLHLDGTVDGAGEDPKAELKMRKAILKYADGFVKALEAGEVGLPTGGDCWFCCMRDQSTGKPLGDLTKDVSHLRSHVEEGYYVPSLAHMAVIEADNTSVVAKQWVNDKMRGHPNDGWPANVAMPQVRAAIANYVLRRLGMETTRTMYRR